MPEARLTFNLEDEMELFKHTLLGEDYHSFLTDLDQALRQWLKYDSCPYDNIEDLMKYIRQEIGEAIHE